MKILIFDSSSLISIATNGLLKELEELKNNSDVEFVITPDVKREVIEKPLTIKRFELEALKIKYLLDNRVIVMSSSLNIKDSEITKRTSEILDVANKTFYGRGRDIHLISAGEASCLALSRILDERKIENVVAVDERTTRMLCEDPSGLRNIFEKKLHTKIKAKEENYKFFKGFKFIRSAELVYVAYKKGIIKYKGKDVLDALLYAVRFKGCNISSEEIKQIKNLK